MSKSTVQDNGILSIRIIWPSTAANPERRKIE